MYQPDTDNAPPPANPLQGEVEEPARSFATFLAILEEGQFHDDLSEELRNLNADMNNAFRDTGGTIKGEMSIKLKFTLKDGLFLIIPDFSVKKPKKPRRQSVAWSTPGNNFSANNPKQMNMFDRPRDVTGFGRGDVKTIA